MFGKLLRPLFLVLGGRDRMDSILLDSGRRVSVEAFYWTRTYAGLFMGNPTEELNTRLQTSAVERTKRLWGERATYLMPPSISNEGGYPALPPVECSVWLSDDVTPITRSGDGSELVVVWYREDCDSESVVSIVSNAVRGVDWNGLASDFRY